MLRKLSLRNAKRQVNDYILYFVTLMLAVGMLYSFNSFVFSEIFRNLSSLVSEVDKNGMLITVIFYSLIIVIVIGWLIYYMTNFMLQKRSKEFATYMLLGIEKKDIALMYMGENAIIGVLALLPGIVVGCVISSGLQGVFGALFGEKFSMQSGMSIQAAGLTGIYFIIIFLFVLIGSKRKLHTMLLIDLLYSERHNETPYTRSTVCGRSLFILSILSGMGSVVIFMIQPFKDYRDMITGFIFIALTFFSFFIGGFSTLNYCLENKINWKYRKNRIVIYRRVISQSRKTALSFGIIASIFSIGMVLISTGTSYNVTVNELTNQEVFDLAILHMNESYDFSKYEKYLSETVDLSGSMTYSLYTEQKQDFTFQRNQTLSDYFKKRKIDAVPEEYLYIENKYDSYMKYSDYCALRKLVGLPEVTMSADNYIVQCMNYLDKDFQSYTKQISEIRLNGKKLSCCGIYTEPFAQYDGYGNGQEFLIIVPDEVADGMDVLYSIYTAKMKEAINLEYLTEFCDHFENLEMLDVNYVQGTTSGTENTMTRLSSDSYDYLEGKYVLFAQRIEVMLILSLIYVGIILFIAGTVIFSVRLLSEIRTQSESYRILKTLGMDNWAMFHMLRCEIGLNFALLLLPLLPLSMGIVYITGRTVLQEYFMVPIFESIVVPIVQIMGLSIMVFLIIYVVYGVLLYLIAKQDMRSVLM